MSDPRPPKPPKRERLVPDHDKIDDAVLALLLLGASRLMVTAGPPSPPGSTAPRKREHGEC